jgi:transposase
LIALGHNVKLMPPACVKAYVKRNKNNAADVEAICEAVTRPSMRFVPIKDVDQQSVLMLHGARALLIRQRTMLVNALRAQIAEFGLIAPQGLRNFEQLIAPADRLERFLSGSTAPVDRVSVMASLPPVPFLREVFTG